MFDMRYHIASLIAVFFALAVGLLLGSLIVDKGVLTEQQEKLVASIRSDIDKLNEQKTAVETKLKGLEDFQSQVFPITVKNRLVDKRMAIVTLTEGQEELFNEVNQALSQAGAGTVPLHIKLESLDFSDKEMVGALGARFDASQTTGGDFERLFWSRLAGELAGKEPLSLIEELAAKELMKYDTASVPIDNLVVLASGKKEVRSRDVLFLEALQQIGQVRVIGTETSAAKPSRMAAYKLRNVSTVDNIDTVPGKISLVYLLEEREVTAHFGIKSTADRLLP